MTKVLITGVGLTSSALGELLIKKGFEVQYLTRNPKRNTSLKCYKWDISKKEIDLKAFKNIDILIHLCGAGVTDKKWTNKRKKEIFESRINSTQLLYTAIKDNNISIKTVIATSAIGYYGTSSKDILFKETDDNSTDFLGNTCKLWEKEILKFNTLGIRTAILRTGVVLSDKGGALSKIIKPIKFNLGTVLEKGNQIIPWIHLDDLCNIYLWTINNERIDGTFNAVAPSFDTNKELTYFISKKLNKKIWLPNTPTWFLKIIFGEMANIFLKGNKISCQKLTKSGFDFKYNSIEKALNDLIKN